MGTPTTIIAVDSHQVYLDLLTVAVNAEVDLAMAGTATTISEAQLLVEKVSPDVVLLESVLPDGDGITTAITLTRRDPRIRVVMLTAAEEGDLVARAAAAGIAGLLLKAGALRQVFETIRAARPGFMIIDPLLLTRLEPIDRTSEPDGDTRDGALPALSPRELAVLRLLDQGSDIRMIARELTISLHTSRGYVKSLLAKLDCHSQLEAVVTARRLGILPGP